ncbi:MAG: alpha-amylase [Clostridia bacterium]|nr:alpha-amylase [Clostridia bacterium]
MKNNNKTMFQFFEWYMPNNCCLWRKIIKMAPTLRKKGITSVWLPPAQKSAGGTYDTGYGVYDLYDLGEFDQKGTVRTKYGTKDEYIAAIKALQLEGIQVLADIVLNHRMGADETQDIISYKVDYDDRNKTIGDYRTIRAWTKFNFEGRNNKYSDFKLDWSHFTSADYDNIEEEHGIFRFYGKAFSNEVDLEKGNYDYLMGCDVDFNNLDVVNDLHSWGKWFLNQTNVDGFRLDAVKHIRFSFYKSWLQDLKREFNRDFYTVGEYYSANIDALLYYLDYNKEINSLFDVPLHFHFKEAAESGGSYDMARIFQNTLIDRRPTKAVTFVDSHDTEPGQSLESWVPNWFRPLAYAMIMFREEGIPCIFYGDYYGVPEKGIPSMQKLLDIFLQARKNLAYGKERDYFDDNNVIGWTREGDYYHQDSGMAVVLSDGPGGGKQMNVGKNLANTLLYDCTGNCKEPVYVDNDGNGIFYCDGGSVSVWIKKDNMYNL